MITQAELKSRLQYNPETGIWIWIIAPKHNSHMLGKQAGSVREDGYRVIRINSRPYYSGRLAFLYMEDYMPNEVDHIDRDTRNDCWSNLRAATSSINKWNQKRLNKTGYTGVYEYGNGYQVRAGNRYVGWYSNLRDAICARNSAACSLSGGHDIPQREHTT